MKQKIDKAIKILMYNLLSFVSFLIAGIGFLGLKLTVGLVTMLVVYLAQSYIGRLSHTLGFIIGLFVAGILYLGIERLFPYLEKLDRKTKKI